MSRALLVKHAGVVRQARLPNGKRVRLVYRPDPTDYERPKFALPAGAPRAPAQWFGLAACASPQLNQMCGSCTGHAEVTADETALNAAGTPLPFHASADGVYRNARGIDRAFVAGVPTTDLSDTGAMPNQVERAVTVFGFEPSKAPDGGSDDYPETINDEPSLKDIETESAFIPLDRHGIEDCSTGRALSAVVADLKAALSCSSWNGKPTKGLPVKFATWVDQAFMNWTGSMSAQGPCNMNDPNGGGHAIVFIGYRANGVTGKTEFLCRNSWSDSWGTTVNVPDAQGNIVKVTGCIWVTEEFVGTCTDLIVVVPEIIVNPLQAV